MCRLVCVFAVATVALSGCTAARRPHAVVTVEAPPTGWRATATEADQQRLAAMPEAWTRALAAVPTRSRAKLRAETELVEPAAALDLPAPPPGPYRCRLVRFGGRGGIATFAPDFCYVGGDAKGLSFTKQTGGTLPGGWLHPDTATRLIFLGALPLPGRKDPPLYGSSPAQDVAGVVERVSPFRWRLVLARAGRGALLDVYELVPVTPAVPGATPSVPARTR